MCYTEWLIIYLCSVTEVTVLSCENIVKVFYNWEKRLSVKRVIKRVKEEKKAEPVSLQTE